ncbi:stage III sporulation protein AD [Bacillus freudenreichii]|nr:stage III sporulation protein AD [Bacillus freudenreichii]
MLILFTGCAIFLFLVDQIHGIITTIEVLAQSAGINTMYVKTILKIIGIAYIAEFASHISKDAGMGAIAAKVELAGKILILALAVPILTVLIDTVIHMMPVR